jgi:hypothetical protein
MAVVVTVVVAVHRFAVGGVGFGGCVDRLCHHRSLSHRPREARVADRDIPRSAAAIPPADRASGWTVSGRCRRAVLDPQPLDHGGGLELGRWISSQPHDCLSVLHIGQSDRFRVRSWHHAFNVEQMSVTQVKRLHLCCYSSMIPRVCATSPGVSHSRMRRSGYDANRRYASHVGRRERDLRAVAVTVCRSLSQS